jgi:hypothetical protein
VTNRPEKPPCVRMRILFTNNTLAERAGTELFVRDVTIELARRGHEVAAFSLVLGDVAAEIRANNIFVSDSLATLPWRPDVIHGHHHSETMAALLRLRDTPALFVSHGWIPWVEIPPVHPRILRYFAVDVPTRTAAAERMKLSSERIGLLPAFVDLKRFQPRPPLPTKPRRALILSNYAREGTHLAFIQEACALAGVTVDTFGLGVGQVTGTPETVLAQYDLVFAKGRSALEAAAVGNAVVVCDAFGVGPMVTLRNAAALQTLAGNYQQLYRPLSVAALLEEIGKYDPSESAAVCRFARAAAGLDRTVDLLCETYQQIIVNFEKGIPADGEEAAAESDYLLWVVRYIKEHPSALHNHDTLTAELETTRGALARAEDLLAKAGKPFFTRMIESLRDS